MSFQSYDEPDYARDGLGSHLIGIHRFEADLEVLHQEIRLGRAGLAAWWTRQAIRDARACGLLEPVQWDAEQDREFQRRTDASEAA